MSRARVSSPSQHSIVVRTTCLDAVHLFCTLEACKYINMLSTPFVCLIIIVAHTRNQPFVPGSNRYILSPSLACAFDVSFLHCITTTHSSARPDVGRNEGKEGCLSRLHSPVHRSLFISNLTNHPPCDTHSRQPAEYSEAPTHRRRVGPLHRN